MVNKPNPAQRRLPLKTYSKEINLLRPGTGIRFTPPEQWGRNAARANPPLRLLLLTLAMGGAALIYFYLPPSSPPVQHTAPPAPPPPPRIMREETVAANAAPVIGAPERAAAAAMPEAGQTAAAKPAEPPPAAPQWRIRFGIFLSRENAEHHAQSLAKKGIVTTTETATRLMTAFTVKAGPVNDSAAWKNLRSAGEKLNVAPMVEVDGKYLVAGPIWLKDRALMAETAFKATGIRTETVEERREREVYRVLSVPFETVDGAKRAIGEMHTNGIEGVIDE